MPQVWIQNDFESWREEARKLLGAEVPPEQVMFVEAGVEQALLAEAAHSEIAAGGAGLASGAAKRVPREFITLASDVARHRDPARWALLYRLLWRLTHGEPRLLERGSDDDDEDVHRARAMAKESRREPMPQPRLIPNLVGDPPRRVEAMMPTKVSDYPTAEPFLPEKLTLPQLQAASRGCKGCPLYEPATQTVFGEGSKDAHIVFVGEQPGDQEDLAGRPFVGPAGQLLDGALEKAGIDRSEAYVTNAVKHFKFEPRGKRRIHSKPNAREIQACKPWLVAEMQVIKPPIVVALGATAAQALMGNAFRVTKERGVPRETQWAPWTMATYHPSALLRMPDEGAREQAYGEFVSDLKKVAKHLATLK